MSNIPAYNIPTNASASVSLSRAHANHVERLEKEQSVLALAIFRAEQNRIGHHGTVPGFKITLGEATSRHEQIGEDLDECVDYTIALINAGTRILAEANKHEATVFHKMLGRPGIDGPDRLRLLADLIEFRCL
jgi:hypothetical protein